MVRAFRLLVVLAAFAPPPGLTQPAQAPEATLELVLDPMAEAPYVGEMILATLRGRYPGAVALEDLELPPIEGFGWMQLGSPQWSEQRSGRRTSVFELRLAFFPQESGLLTIAPITHRLTFASGGGRAEAAATSAPVALEVKPGLATGEEWWLPARAVAVRDEWEPAPDRLGPQEWTVRTVTLEVAGQPPHALPAPPPMYAGGLFTFEDPEERGVRLTPEGPISTVVWRYRMQPQTGAPAHLDDIPIPWFDTQARSGRSLLLEGRQISFAATAFPREPGPLARWSVPGGALAGAAVGLALLLPRLGLRRRRAVGRVGRALASLRQAARIARAERAGNGPAARAALLAFLRLRGGDPARSQALLDLDRTLFGPQTGEPPSLKGLTRTALFGVPRQPPP